MSFTKNPRFAPFLMVVLGGAAVAIFIAIDGMSLIGRAGGKAIFLLGIGSIAFGVGLAQLVWPPPPPTHDEGFALLDSFARASGPQKVLYVFGGLVGAVAAAVVQTMASGNI